MKVLDLDLDVYQGPFDLLLSLVLREEIDLLEVPLLDVILAYVEQVEAEGSADYWDEMIAPAPA
jgi:segregation and condensation protein A